MSDLYFTNWNDIPLATYGVVLADPPWAYRDKMKGHSFSLDHEYPTQSAKWIRSLPVSAVTLPDSALFLWVVSPQLDTGIEVLRSWGFKYKTVAFCWSKLTPSGKDVMNLGRWTHGNVELCLLGTRGRPQRLDRTVRQLVRAVRTHHSAKPPEVHGRIERLLAGPRLELFRRGAPPAGWDAFGNEPPTSPGTIAETPTLRTSPAG